MLRQEKEEVREFVKEQLCKGYIRPSKLLQTLPVFFMGERRGWYKIIGISIRGHVKDRIPEKGDIE